VAVADSFWDARQEASSRVNSKQVRAARIYGEIRDLERRLGNERNEVRAIERQLDAKRNEVRAIERCCY
jgi:chromosome segregation ATPase